MEKVQEIIPKGISLRELLSQEYGGFIWTQVGKHKHGILWEKVLRTLEVWRFDKGWESEYSEVPRWSTRFL